jgi:hypothetical protein
MRTHLKVLAVVACAAGAAIGLVPVARAAEESAEVRPPEVTGPITGGIKGYPFGSAPDLPAGYTENEYFISGMATAYDASPVALASAGMPVQLPDLPYTTRIVVRAPAERAKFKGTVLVEWNNVTSGYDVEPAWVDTWPELGRKGLAYVSVTAQTVGVNALHAYDPVRYAPLVLPGDEYSYDVFSQAIKALRQSSVDGPMHGLAVQRVLATGDSQSGSALDHYVSSVEPTIEHLVDGFLIQTSTGKIPDVLDVPVIRLLSEREAGGGSDSASGNYQRWEIAGASHTDTWFGHYAQETQNRDWGTPAGTWPLAPADSNPGAEGPCYIGSLHKRYAARTAVRALNAWVVNGTAPVEPPPVEQLADGSIARDLDGNAKGGLRLPDIQAPKATYYGDADNECAFTLGKTVFFTREQLERRYTDEAGYVAAVTAAVDVAVINKWVLPEDRKEIIAAAKAFTFPEA